MAEQLQTTPEELLLLIGERELVKYKQQQEIQKLYKQIDEMSAEITKLKTEIEDLKKPKLVRQDG